MKSDIPITPWLMYELFFKIFRKETGALCEIGCDAQVSIVWVGLDAMGLAEYLVIHGTARVTEGGAPELLQRLAHTYLGPDVRFPPWTTRLPDTSPTSRSNGSPAVAPRPHAENLIHMADGETETRLLENVLDALDDLYDRRDRAEWWTERLLQATSVALRGTQWEHPMAEAATDLKLIRLSDGTDDAKNAAALAATGDLRLQVAGAL